MNDNLIYTKVVSVLWNVGIYAKNYLLSEALFLRFEIFPL